MNVLKKIESALISVYYKDKLDGIVKKLHDQGVKLYSTGGTQTFIENLGIPVTPVEDITGYPSILGGRVKTLHPKVFGGILSRRDLTEDRNQVKQYEIPDIDLVVVDLYPFEETVESGASEEDIFEKIDIGGISLIRAAAKNFKDVVIVSSREQYDDLFSLLESKNGETSLKDRRLFAQKAFATSSHYDSAIFNYFNNSQSDSIRVSLNNGKELRYGENPHQSATFFKFNNTCSNTTFASAPVLQGKALSYNNLLDADAAWKVAGDAWHSVDLQGKVVVAVIKHLNPCGLAVSSNTMEALELAWAGDPVSAYGGIVCFTSAVTAEIAEWFSNRFVEIIIAPEFTPEALTILEKKKNLRVLKAPIRPEVSGEKIYRSISGGLLVQDEDEAMDTDFETVTKISFDQNKIKLAKFGIMACKHLKSNAIALVTETPNGSFWLTGTGMGQPNRLDSLRQLTIPRFNLKEGIDMKEAVLISDAFFPFRDSIDTANEFGVRYIVQPGGSIRDEEVIQACDEFGIAMAFTQRRHFRH